MTYLRFALSFMLAAVSAVVAFAGGGGVPNALKNATFSEVNGAIPAGWEHRTKSSGTVSVLTEVEAEGPFLRVGVKGDKHASSIIQQVVPVPKDTARVRLSAMARFKDVVPGKEGYMRGVVQVRFLSGKKETGKWIELKTMRGSSSGFPAWHTFSNTVKVPKGADGVFMRVALYNVGGGHIDVRDPYIGFVNHELHAQLVKEAQERAAIERVKYRPAEQFGTPVSDARFNKLTKGLNINNWFGQPYNVTVNGVKGKFSKEHFETFITDDEFALLAHMGFNHIRFVIEPFIFMNVDNGELKTEHLASLDKAIQRMLSAGLAVIVDAHPKMPAYRKMRTNTKVNDNFVVWWGKFAKHLSKFDPEWVFLEVLNEPGGQSYYNQQWYDYQDKLFTEIRKHAPEHTLLGNTGGWQTVDDLESYVPHPDRNIIYAIHYYEPSQFTHQGAVWMKKWYHPLKNIPWPLTNENLKPVLDGLPTKGKMGEYAKESRKALQSAVKQQIMTLDRVPTNFAKAKVWSDKYQRRVVMGEFGVLRDFAPIDDRVKWIQIVRETSEANNVGWTMWEYAHSFGLMDGPSEPGKRKVNIGIAKALGMKTEGIPKAFLP